MFARADTGVIASRCGINRKIFAIIYVSQNVLIKLYFFFFYFVDLLGIFFFNTRDERKI